jgi:hypothetical protein
VAHEAQLEWEARAARPAAAAALASAALTVVALILQAAALRDRPPGDRGSLIRIDERSTELLGGSIVQVLSLLLLGVAVACLYRVIKYRRPETPSFVFTLAVAGPVLLSAGLLLNQLEIQGIAADFTEAGPRTEKRADDLIGDRSIVGSVFAFAGQLSIAFSLVVANLNALRAGVESRFLAIIGVIAGFLIVLPILGPPVIQIFWLVAVGLLFLGRWPGGRGPAWETGETAPWPSAAERARAAGGAPEPEPAEREELEAEGAEPVPRKRKRRRRR